jgi:itaconate CoA-transferase
MMQPLSGIIVISLEVAVAAPFASRQLADLGARVIKIERPGIGDFARGYDDKAHGLSSHFVWTNRSKESLTLNLKHDSGKEVLSQLLNKADVFIHNLGPGAVDRLGFRSERLRIDFPELIICTISGYGSTGPYRDKKAYDLLIQAEAGLLSITGTAETPSKVGISVADIAAGMYAFSGILSALLARHQTGQGTTIEVSMLEALGEWMGFPMYYTLGGSSPSRSGSRHASIAPYGPFPSGDDGVVILGIQNEPEWRRFCEIALRRPSLAYDERFNDNMGRVNNRSELREIIETIFKELTLTEVVSRLEQADIANAKMNSLDDFLEHQQLAARQRWGEVESPVGFLPALMPPVIIAGVEPVIKPIPALGEHTDKILMELGYSSLDISELRSDNIV